MNRKTAIVTGASSGIGLGLVTELLDRDLHVIAVSRPSEKAKKNSKHLASKGNIDWLFVDISSLKEVKKIANEILSRYAKIDFLFNIAGCLKVNLEKTADNLEAMFATNYLGHFLLTNLLFPLLKKSRKARILTISGEGHRHCLPANFSLDNLDYDKILSIENYASGYASKQVVLAKILFSYELSRRLQEYNIESCTFCPGLVRTNLMSDFPWYIRKIAQAQMLFQGARSPSDLAMDICKLAFHFKDINGRYYVIRKSGIRPELSSPESYHEELAKKLWNISEYLTDETFDKKYFDSA